MEKEKSRQEKWKERNGIEKFQFDCPEEEKKEIDAIIKRSGRSKKIAVLEGLRLLDEKLKKKRALS